MKYIYDDEYMTKDLSEDLLERLEDDAVMELDRLDINDRYYFEKLTKLNVYIQIAKLRFEEEVMQKKYKMLKAEYNTYLDELKAPKEATKKPSVKSVKLFRG
jgi:hypothetical protein